MQIAPERVRELAQQCAGAGAAAVMQLAPDVVMPSEAIGEAVERILADFGVPESGALGWSEEELKGDAR